MKMPKSDHPLWGLARMFILLVATITILWMNASEFDATEIKSIAQLLLVMIAAEGGSKLLGRG